MILYELIAERSNHKYLFHSNGKP